MIGTIDVNIQAKFPNLPLDPFQAFVGSASSVRVRNVPRKIGKWEITAVNVNVSYPDNTTVAKACVLTGGVWVGTVGGCATSGTCTNGFVITASGTDEDGNTVSNYVLGAGNVLIKQLDGTIAPETTAARMYFYDTLPTSPKKGDSIFVNGTLSLWNGTQWQPAADLSGKQDKLLQAQIEAVNSGATAAKVATWDGYAQQIAAKRDLADLHYVYDPQVILDPMFVRFCDAVGELDGTVTCDYDGSGWNWSGEINYAWYDIGILPVDTNAYQITITPDGDEPRTIDFVLVPPTYSATVYYQDQVSLTIYQQGTNLATEKYAVRNDGGVAKVKSISQSDYDDLSSPDASTLYVIPEEEEA